MSLQNSGLLCCVDNCKSDSNKEEHSLFSFPKDNARCKAWLDNIPKIFIDKHHAVSTKDLKVCAKHFTEDMFSNSTKNCLLPNAVPTIFENKEGKQEVARINDSKIEFVLHLETEDISNDEKDSFFENLSMDPRKQTVRRIEKAVPDFNSEKFSNLINDIPRSQIYLKNKEDESIDKKDSKEVQESILKNILSKKPKRKSKKTVKRVLTKNKQTKKFKEPEIKTFVEFKRKDFYKICRICFMDDETALLDIFNSKCAESTFVSILDKINNNEQNNNLSRFICDKCTKHLLKYHNFAKKIEKSTATLTEVYKNLTESKTRQSIRISESCLSSLTLEDCQSQCYSESVKEQPLQYLEPIKIESIDIDCGTFENNDITDMHDEESNWSEEDYDSLIKIKTDISRYIKLDEFKEEVPEKYEYKSEDESIDSLPPIPVKRKYTRRTQPVLAKRVKLPTTGAEQDLTCIICDKLFPSKYSLTTHRKNVHTSVQCDVCQMRLKGASVRWHMRVMHSIVNGVEDKEKAAPRKVLCTQCGKWVRAHKYKIHLRTHLVVKPFACDLCDYRTIDRSRLIPHKLLHTGEKPYLCATCGEGFHRKDYLKLHFALHSNLENPIVCQSCAQQFQTKFDYQTHRRIIHGYQKVGGGPRVKNVNIQLSTEPKPSTRNCPICQKVFQRNSKAFYKHMREHNPKVVRCDICEKQCNSTEALKSHMRSHTGEKPFKCKLCDKAYSQYGHLQAHRASFHENKRAFRCEVCDKAFNLAISLKEHLRIHTGETLDCEHCGKAFKQRSNFYKHLREVHDIRKRESNAAGSTCLTVLSTVVTE